MSTLDHQLGIFSETTYGTSGTPTKFFEFESEGIEETENRTEGDPLRTGTYVKRSDRFTPYFAGASGQISLAVMTKGFGYLFQQCLGVNTTTGPTETNVYTHTATMGDLTGKSFSAQFNRDFSPSGTNQPFLYKGGKVTGWELANSVDGNLLLNLDCDFQQVDTATALATAAYPSGMIPLTWAGGTCTVGGTAFDITEVSVKGDNGLQTDRRFIRANTDKKEPTGSRRSVEWSMSADFADMTQRARVHATTQAGTLAAIVLKWQGPTLLGTTIYPNVTVTIPAARFDSWKASSDGPDPLTQELSGVALYDGTSSAVTIAYQSADITI